MKKRSTPPWGGVAFPLSFGVDLPSPPLVGAFFFSHFLLGGAAWFPFSGWCCRFFCPFSGTTFLLSSVGWSCLVHSFLGWCFHLFCWVVLLGLLPLLGGAAVQNQKEKMQSKGKFENSGKVANIIRCLWCFTLLMNLHDFVAEPVNPEHIFHDAHTVSFCLTDDHIATCHMFLCPHQVSTVLVCLWTRVVWKTFGTSDVPRDGWRSLATTMRCGGNGAASMESHG